MDIPAFEIVIKPVTKKTHNRIGRTPKKGARRCAVCGHLPSFPKVLPSEQFEEFHKAVMPQLAAIKVEMRRRGVLLPIVALVNVRAIFYRDRLQGDAVGFYQALADVLEDAGIVENDKQCVSWDGSRLAKDAGRPRIEVQLEVVEMRAVEQDLFAEATR